MAGVWRMYAGWMRKWPLGTSMGTAAVLMGAGDATAQHLADAKSFDWKRNVTVSSWNALVFAPVFFVWFGWLDRRFPGSSLRMAAAKVAANQFVMVLPINAGFLAYTLSLEDLLQRTDQNVGTLTAAPRPPLRERVRDKLWHDLPKICVSSLLVWGPTNLANFMLVPQQYRVLPTIAVSFVWNTFVSGVVHDLDLLAWAATPTSALKRSNR